MMTNLRKEARGRECQVRIYAYAMATLKLQFWRITEWLEFAEREQSQMICWLHGPVVTAIMKSIAVLAFSTTTTPDFTTWKA